MECVELCCVLSGELCCAVLCSGILLWGAERCCPLSPQFMATHDTTSLCNTLRRSKFCATVAVLCSGGVCCIA